MQPSPRHYQTMRPIASAQPDPRDIELAGAEWYWGKITREEARNVLLGKSEGSFLVRDALTKDGEYTLTLIKNGTEKLIKINRENDKFGFVDCKFNSVVELINFYKVNSLKYYNKMLDITLRHPVTRQNHEDELELLPEDLNTLIEWYYETLKAYKSIEPIYNNKYEEFKAAEQDLHKKKSNIELLLKTRAVLEEQKETLMQNLNRLKNEESKDNAKEIEAIEENKANQERIIASIADVIRNCSENIEQIKNEYEASEWQVNSAKMEMLPLNKKKNKLFTELLRRGLPDSYIKKLALIGPEKFCRELDRFRNQPHEMVMLWLYESCDREQAEEILNGAITGTFLIRKRSDNDNYALSIAYNGSVLHCIIQKFGRSYGFTHCDVFPSLELLVEFYVANSLNMLNTELHTTLTLPVGYWLEHRSDIMAQLEEEQREVESGQLEKDAADEEEDEEEREQEVANDDEDTESLMDEEERMYSERENIFINEVVSEEVGQMLLKLHNLPCQKQKQKQ